MLLTKLRIRKLGPFHDPFEIGLEPRVTILTGANDVGKSFVLRAIELLLTEGIAEEKDINQDHVQETHSQWISDHEPGIEADFRLDSTADVKQPRYRWTQGDTGEARRRVAKEVAKTEFVLHTKQTGDVEWPVNMPRLVRAPSGDSVGETIDLAKPNPLEAALLQAAFSAPFSYQKYRAMGSINFTRAVRDAEDRLNAYMERVMPSAASLRFSLETIEGNRQQMAILLRDRYDGMTPFGLRGAGLRKMVTLLAELLTHETAAHHRIVLLDEPENSLHADAQHLLREFLFRLTEQGTTQVIYATHSSSMVNPLRSEQIRLLCRETRNGKATSQVSKGACDRNFFGLRSSLGMTAADSLLFAPVTIIIEGKTEFACLPFLFEKLEAAALAGFSAHGTCSPWPTSWTAWETTSSFCAGWQSPRGQR